MKKPLIAVVLSLVLANLVFAHGGMEHVLGTVTAVSSHSITVKTTAGEAQEVEVDAATKFSRDKAAAALSDVKVGDRVVIHASKKNDRLEAAEVELGPKTPAKAARHGQ